MTDVSIAERTHSDDYVSDGESPVNLDVIRHAVAAWRAGTLAQSVAKMSPRQARFSTWSDVEVPDGSPHTELFENKPMMTPYQRLARSPSATPLAASDPITPFSLPL